MKKQLEAQKHFQILANESISNELKKQYTFEILRDGDKQGEIKFAEIKISNLRTAVINNCWFSDSTSANALLKEATMCAWEMGFDLMIGTCISEQLKCNGFKKIAHSTQEVLCSELSWNALERADLDSIISLKYSHN